MKQQELLQWLGDLATEPIATESVSGRLGIPTTRHKIAPATAWLTNAQTALEATFPQNHAVLKKWAILASSIEKDPNLSLHTGTLESARAIVAAAHDQVQNGRLGSFVDSIRADTVSELLDQADYLASKNWLAAATVLGGAALETHLRYLCEKNAIIWNGSGSISSYDQAISTERKSGRITIYDKNDSKQIVAWGGLRNDAAHDPTSYNRSKAEVELMLQGIRQFAARIR